MSNGYIQWDLERGSSGFPSCNCNTSHTSINYVEKCRKTQSTEVLEKREICRKRLELEHAKEKLSDFGKNFIDDEVGNYIDPSLT